MAICSAVARTSNCPIADWRGLRSVESSSGKTLVAALRSVIGGLLKPNRSACSRSASSPRSSPIDANAVLQEMRSALVSVVWSLGPQARPLLLRDVGRCLRQVEHRGPWHDRVWRVAARLQRRCSGHDLERRPRRVVARDRPVDHGSRGSALSASQVSCWVGMSWLASGLGSYVGRVTIARISPVVGSSATTAPRNPAARRTPPAAPPGRASAARCRPHASRR